MPFSNVAGSYVNQAWRNQRHWVTDLHLKLKSGLIKSSVFYPAARVFPPTDGPYGGGVQKPKEVFMREDKIRHMFRVLYPVEATKTWMSGKGDEKWFMHPQDKWVRDHLEFMDKGMSLKEAHQRVMQKREQDALVDRLEQKYRLQKLQEQGVPPTGSMPLDSAMLVAKEEAAKRDLMRTDEVEQHKFLHMLVMLKLSEPEETRTKISTKDIVENVKLFPDYMISTFIEAHPQYEHLFDDIVLYESTLARLFFPLHDHAEAEKIRSVMAEVDRRWDEAEPVIKNRMGIFAGNLHRWLKVKQLNGKVALFDEEVVSHMDAMDSSTVEEWKQNNIQGDPETTGGAILEFLEFSGVKDAKELHEAYKNDIQFASDKLNELMAKYDTSGEYKKNLVPLREQQKPTMPEMPDDTQFGLYPPKTYEETDLEKVQSESVLKLMEEYIALSSAGAEKTKPETIEEPEIVSGKSVKKDSIAAMMMMDEKDVEPDVIRFDPWSEEDKRKHPEIYKRYKKNETLRRMQTLISEESDVYTSAAKEVFDPVSRAAEAMTLEETKNEFGVNLDEISSPVRSIHEYPEVKFGLSEVPFSENDSDMEALARDLSDVDNMSSTDKSEGSASEAESGDEAAADAADAEITIEEKLNYLRSVASESSDAGSEVESDLEAKSEIIPQKDEQSKYIFKNVFEVVDHIEGVSRVDPEDATPSSFDINEQTLAEIEGYNTDELLEYEHTSTEDEDPVYRNTYHAYPESQVVFDELLERLSPGGADSDLLEEAAGEAELEESNEPVPYPDPEPDEEADYNYDLPTTDSDAYSESDDEAEQERMLAERAKQAEIDGDEQSDDEVLSGDLTDLSTDDDSDDFDPDVHRSAVTQLYTDLFGKDNLYEYDIDEAGNVVVKEGFEEVAAERETMFDPLVRAMREKGDGEALVDEDGNEINSDDGEKALETASLSEYRDLMQHDMRMLRLHALSTNPDSPQSSDDEELRQLKARIKELKENNSDFSSDWSDDEVDISPSEKDWLERKRRMLFRRFAPSDELYDRRLTNFPLDYPYLPSDPPELYTAEDHIDESGELSELDMNDPIVKELLGDVDINSLYEFDQNAPERQAIRQETAEFMESLHDEDYDEDAELPEDIRSRAQISYLREVDNSIVRELLKKSLAARSEIAEMEYDAEDFTDFDSGSGSGSESDRDK